ncbi:hypothetical protein [Arthrobacter sp. P2b]|uniref:hypothetical protein n=1 Tax=Arthrobacter sp. P2b TaxID=1938741 RepID=UPI0009CADE02|nr:hypothetical protein SAMN06272721_11611 [Arthrobacter sp. P2b]
MAAARSPARLKELLAGRGREVYVLADSSKLSLRPFHVWARLALLWILVTDDGADPEQVQKPAASGLQVEMGVRASGTLTHGSRT